MKAAAGRGEQDSIEKGQKQNNCIATRVRWKKSKHKLMFWTFALPALGDYNCAWGHVSLPAGAS